MSETTTWLTPVSWLLLAGMVSAASHAFPTIYPTGTTIYDPDRAWNGYTVYRTPDDKGVVLIDMNGNIVRRWADVVGLGRILPGGHIIGVAPEDSPDGNDGAELVQKDWEGNVIWSFNRTEQMETEDGGTVWSARLHHDWQREGFPAGYYAPESSPAITGGRTLILAHTNVTVPEINERLLRDDRILEVSWDGEVLWDWLVSEHVDEMGFSRAARDAIRAQRGAPTQPFDWLHINAATYLGPNQWYDQGDERFHPDNVIFSARHANIVGIVDRSGEIVVADGPRFSGDRGVAGDRPDHRATPSAHHSERPSRCWQCNGIRQRWRSRLRRTQSRCPERPQHCREAQFTSSRNQPGHDEDRLGVFDFRSWGLSFLQFQRECGATPAQWEYPDHRGRDRACL